MLKGLDLSRLGTGVLLGAMVLTGCASPPEAERKAAEEALGAARSAGAETYAAADFTAAASAVKQAGDDMTAKKYDAAKAAYAKAKELGDKAAKAAESGKAAVKAEVEQKLAEAEKRWQEIEGKAKAAGKRLAGDLKAAWDTDVKAVTDALQAAKAAAASDPAGGKQKLDAAVALLEKWEGQLAALVKAPAKKAEAPKKK